MAFPSGPASRAINRSLFLSVVQFSRSVSTKALKRFFGWFCSLFVAASLLIIPNRRTDVNTFFRFFKNFFAMRKKQQKLRLFPWKSIPHFLENIRKRNRRVKNWTAPSRPVFVALSDAASHAMGRVSGHRIWDGICAGISARKTAERAYARSVFFTLQIRVSRL